jgi:hypothetical protein
MFILIRPISAVFLGIFAYFAALAYEPLFAPNADLGRLPWTAARVAAFIGWVYLGGHIKRAMWYSVYSTLQAIVMTAVATAYILSIREIFILGYRRRYDEVAEAIADTFPITIDWLMRALVPDYLLFLLAGGVSIGVMLHLIWVVLERRRNDR